MCSTGGGNSVLESVVDVALQTGTLGLVGYKDEEGGFAPGVVTKESVGLLKDVTGATAAEEANEMARDAARKEREARLQEREDIRAQTTAEQIRLSQQAGGVRSRAGAGTGVATGLQMSNLGGERDFLGL